MLFPGPEAIQYVDRPSQELCTSSQGNPVFMQMGPLVFGDTSPKLVEAKAATILP